MAGSHCDDQVAGGEATAEDRQQPSVDRHVHRDVPEHAAAIEHRHGAHAFLSRSLDAYVQPRSGDRRLRNSRDKTGERSSVAQPQGTLERGTRAEASGGDRGGVKLTRIDGDGTP